MSAEEVLGKFDFNIEVSIEPGWLIHSIAETIAKAKNSYEQVPDDQGGLLQAEKVLLSNEFYRLAEYIAVAPLLPVENSPLQGKSLGEVLTNASGVPFGAYIGYVIAGGLSPMLVFWVPAGMIFFGAVTGFANGLSEGLREKIKTMIGGGNSNPNPSKPKPKKHKFKMH